MTDSSPASAQPDAASPTPPSRRGRLRGALLGRPRQRRPPRARGPRLERRRERRARLRPRRPGLGGRRARHPGRAARVADLRARAVAPLVVLDLDMHDVYPRSHWAIRGAAPAYDTPDEDVYIVGRNIVLLTKAAIACAYRGIGRIAIGPLAGNPFPDATPEFFAAMGRALSLGLAHGIVIEAPFVSWEKSAVIARGLELQCRSNARCRMSPVDTAARGSTAACAASAASGATRSPRRAPTTKRRTRPPRRVEGPATTPESSAGVVGAPLRSRRDSSRRRSRRRTTRVVRGDQRSTGRSGGAGGAAGAEEGAAGRRGGGGGGSCRRRCASRGAGRRRRGGRGPPRERSPDSCANTSPESSLTEPSRASASRSAPRPSARYSTIEPSPVDRFQSRRSSTRRRPDHHAAVLGADPQPFEPALHRDAAVVGCDVALPVDALEPDGAVLGVRHDVAGEIAAGDAAVPGPQSTLPLTWSTRMLPSPVRTTRSLPVGTETISFAERDAVQPIW